MHEHKGKNHRDDQAVDACAQRAKCSSAGTRSTQAYLALGGVESSPQGLRGINVGPETLDAGLSSLREAHAPAIVVTVTFAALILALQGLLQVLPGLV